MLSSGGFREIQLCVLCSISSRGEGYFVRIILVPGFEKAEIFAELATSLESHNQSAQVIELSKLAQPTIEGAELVEELIIKLEAANPANESCAFVCSSLGLSLALVALSRERLRGLNYATRILFSVNGALSHVDPLMGVFAENLERFSDFKRYLGEGAVSQILAQSREQTRRFFIESFASNASAGNPFALPFPPAFRVQLVELIGAGRLAVKNLSSSTELYCFDSERDEQVGVASEQFRILHREPTGAVTFPGVGHGLLAGKYRREVVAGILERLLRFEG